MRRRAVAIACSAVLPLAVADAAPDLLVRMHPGKPAQVLAASSIPEHASRPLLSAGPAGSGGARPGHPLASWVVLRFVDEASLQRALAALERHPAVAYVERVRTMSLCEMPTVATDTPPNVLQICAPEALSRVVPDTSLVVGIIDTGVDLTHPDLVRRLWRNDDPPGNADPADDATDQNGDGLVEAWERDDDDDNGYVDDEHGFDFTDAPGRGGVGDALDRDADPSDEHGHGTHVAGILAAEGSLQGVAPFVRILAVRAAYTTAFGGGVLETDDAAAAIVYAVDNGARILNLSWGDREESLVVREAVAYAIARGVLVVAAAGNGNTDAPHYPSGEPAVLGVGAVDATGQRAAFSNFGPGVTLVAPGELHTGANGGIESLAPGGGRERRRGTSMAAPHVAGVAAILMSRADRPGAEAVRALLVASARRTGSEPWSSDRAHGLVDACAGVRLQDDLVLDVHGPPRPVRDGRFVLVGSVLSGDLRRWRVDVRRSGSAGTSEVVAWSSRRVLADTLVDASVRNWTAGRWEYVLAAETGDARRREVHGWLEVDVTPPRWDSLGIVPAWRGPRSLHLLTLVSDDEVSAEARDAGERLMASEAGFAQRLQLEMTDAGSASPWHLRIENAAGLASDSVVSVPVALTDWPRGGALLQLGETASFSVEPVWGTEPGGASVVWGRSGTGRPGSVWEAWSQSGNALERAYSSASPGRPVAYEDANGDGRADLMVQNAGRAEWWLVRPAGRWPDSLAASVPVERVLGLFQLDADAAFEALLSSRDTLYLYDDTASGPPRRLQALANPNRFGFNVWGADAAVGDLDGDGRIEIACGDAEGDLAVFERDGAGTFGLEWRGDSEGVYAYDFSPLPEGGFVVGRQRTASVTGDGFTHAIYEFRPYAPASGGYVAAAGLPFVGGENELASGSVAVQSSASGETWLALVKGTDLYLSRGRGLGRVAAAHSTGAVGDAPAILDLDGDGRLDVVLRTSTGTTLYALEEGVRGPHDLTAEALAANRIELRWKPAPGTTSRILREKSKILGETSGEAWIDSSVTPGVLYAYEIQGVAGGVVRGISNQIWVRARARPRLLEAAQAGVASLRVRCSNPLGPSGLEVRRWRVSAGGREHEVAAVTLAAEGREVLLVLRETPACGTWTVWADSVRDDSGGLMQPPISNLDVASACPPSRFYLVDAAAERNAVTLRFNRAPDSLALDPERYALTWPGGAIGITAVESSSPKVLRLKLADGDELQARGVPYRLRLDAGLRAAGDAAPLESPQTEYAIHVEGSGASRLAPTPNPVRPGTREVVFTEAASSTTVRIYTLEGELVRQLSGAYGGGLRWDLRGGENQILPSGTYLYVARDASGTRGGSIVLLR